MGWNDHIDWDMHERVEEAVDRGFLERGTRAHGVAQQIISQGLDSLSEKQRWVYEKELAPALQGSAKEAEQEETLYRLTKEED